MHNRVRVAVASFLVKYLLSPWQRGAEWLWEALSDAKLANNTLDWQRWRGMPQAQRFARQRSLSRLASRDSCIGTPCIRCISECSRMLRGIVAEAR
jgi:hypothetical protein